MLKMTSKGFAQIPNVAFAFGTDYKLNKDDVQIYAYLQFAKSVGTMMVRTNVEIIVEDLGWETSKASRDKARVAVSLENLMNKGYIKINFKKDIKKDNLTIEIVKKMKDAEVQSTVEWKQKPFTFKKYTTIKADEYNLAGENDYHLLMIGYYLWRNNADFEYAICDKEWAEVLELSVKRTRTIIDDYTPFLNKFSGDKYKDDNGQWKQEPNQYKIDKHLFLSTKMNKIETEAKNVSYRGKHAEKITDMEILINQKVFDAIFDFQKGRWDAESYKAWKETKCKHTKKTGQLKIDKLSKSEGGRNLVERLEKEYQQGLDDEIARENAFKVLEARAEANLQEEIQILEEAEYFESPYKRKDNKNDISQWLDDDDM